MLISRLSPFSGKINTLEIPCTPDQLELWESGELIQDAMPNVPVELREFLISGITPAEWDALFGPEE